MDSKAISLAWAEVWDVPIPAISGDLGEVDSGLRPIVVKETQFDSFSDLGEYRKVGRSTVKLGAERVALASEYLH